MPVLAIDVSRYSSDRGGSVSRGREVTDWLTDSGYDDIPIEHHPQKETVRNG